MASAQSLVIPPPQDSVSMAAPSTSTLMVNVPSAPPVRAMAPRKFTPGLLARAGVGSTLQGVGAMMAEGSQSVADAVRMRKEGYVVADGVPVTGQYIDEIRAMAAKGSAISQKTMPNQGYAAASYLYANQNAGRVGAALAGVINPPRGVKSSRYYIPTSIAEERKRQMATLMGLGGFGALPDVVLGLSLKNDVSSADVVTSPDAKEDDTDNLFGGGTIVGENHDDPNALVNVRKIKVIRVVKAFKEATGREPTLADIKFYAKTHLIPDIAGWRFLPNGLIPPNGSAKEILDGGGSLNDRNPYGPLVVFIQYAESRRGNSSIDTFEGGKWTSAVAKSVEDELGSALDALEKKAREEFDRRMAEQNAPPATPPNNNPSTQQPPTNNVNDAIRRRFSKDNLRIWNPVIRRGEFTNARQNTSTKDAPKDEPKQEEKKSNTGLIVGVVGVLALGGIALMLARKKA